MSVFVDSSALLKRYLDEPDRDRFQSLLRSDPQWILARHASVEVRRTLVRDLPDSVIAEARRRFLADWARATIVDLDIATCDLACDFAEALGVRTLDALHLAAAHRVGGGALPFLTADLRQAQAARSLGWTVLGT